MISFTFHRYVNEIPKGIEALLVGDIGGTNSNFGIFKQDDGRLILLLSLHTKSQEIKSFTDVVRDVLKQIGKEYNISCKRACFAAAGVPSQDRMHCKPTNLPFIIDIQDILDKTALDCAFIVNDFLVIGYGLQAINKKDLVCINEGTISWKANKAIVGAGTGLGKSILYWSEEYHRYIPLPSEGGHADFVVHNQIEFDLMHFIQKTEHRGGSISWEDVLSGEGIRRLYRFFQFRKGDNINSIGDGPHPDEIFRSCSDNEHCFATFQLYTQLYARCAKNFALDALAMGGMYIAGGIAAKNIPLFKQELFMKEFVDCQKQHKLLTQIPIFIIGDYNISLYGAAALLVLDGTC